MAAGLFLLAASGVSCGGNGAEETVSASVDSLARADTLALVKGLQLFEDGEYENAREQLRVSARSASNYIRAESFLYLNAVEMELGNYDVARAHLDRYHAETVRLLRGVADASQRTAEQTVHLRRRQDSIIIWTVVVAVIMVGTALFFWRKGAVRSQVSIDGNDSATGRRVLPPVDTSAWKGWLVDAEIFKQSAIWAEIVSLAAQKPGREARVLPSARQEVLDGELSERFSDFAARLRADYPTLTAGDVKLCCLSLLPLSPFARALCFGSTETNIVKQRKHTIKKKMAGETPGRELFEFIFEAREEYVNFKENVLD